MTLRTFVALAGAAAGLMYLFDPDTGTRRRAQMREHWTGLGGALLAMWGLRRLDELVDALGELVQG